MPDIDFTSTISVALIDRSHRYLAKVLIIDARPDLAWSAHVGGIHHAIAIRIADQYIHRRTEIALARTVTGAEQCDRDPLSAADSGEVNANAVRAAPTGSTD